MLVDNESQEGNSVEAQAEDGDRTEAQEAKGDEESPGGDAEPEALRTEEDEELAEAGVRIAELEEVVSNRDSEIASLKQYAEELEEMLSGTKDSLAEAVASYRDVIIQTNPGVVEELIGGDSVDAINESLHRAKSLLGKVRQGLEAEISQARVPAGAPERRAPDLSSLSPREKIEYGIGGKR